MCDVSNRYIKISRSIAEHWLWADAERLKWWLDLLLLASRKDHKALIGGNLVEIKRGQLYVSQRHLQERWAKRNSEGAIISKPTSRTIWKFLSLLESESMIAIQKQHHLATLVIISNYAQYQEPNSTTNSTTNSTKQKKGKERDKNNIISSNEDISKNPKGFLASDARDARAKGDFEKIVEKYHETCTSYPRLAKLSDARKAKMQIRFYDEMKGDWQLLESVFAKMEQSKFLRGDNKSGWRASFDWLFQNSTNWVKVAEGNYDNRKIPTQLNQINPNEEWQ